MAEGPPASISGLSGGVARKIERPPPHVRAGILAYRAALNRREDWHDAVAAAIETALEAKEADV